MSVHSLDKLFDLASESEKKMILKMKKMYSGFGKVDAKMAVWRVSTIDSIVNDYISKNHQCTVINIACGFDTRYWRIDKKDCIYIELDLPEVIDQKKELLGAQIDYKMISSSVLDFSWIDEVTKDRNRNFIIVMEGLLYYLQEEDVKKLLYEISRRFTNSQLVTDAAPKKMSKGFYRKLSKWSAKLLFGFEMVWNSGFKKAEDLESYGNYSLVNVEGKMPYVITASIN